MHFYNTACVRPGVCAFKVFQSHRHYHTIMLLVYRIRAAPESGLEREAMGGEHRNQLKLLKNIIYGKVGREMSGEKALHFEEHDNKALEKLRCFIPEKIFDIHSHIVHPDFMDHFRIIDAEQLKGEQGAITGGTVLRFNLIPYPTKKMGSPGAREYSTEFLKQELIKHPEHVGEAIVLPWDNCRDVEAQLVHPNIKGFKCYHNIIRKHFNTFDAAIEEFLPDSVWEVANHYSFHIMLHLVTQSLADPGNIEYIQKMTERYKNVRLILPHAARALAAWTLIENIEMLKDNTRVLFDVSGICESPAIIKLIRTVGHKRVLWGSDYPETISRGKCISVSDTFVWLYWDQLKHYNARTPFNMNLIGVEALRAMEQACHILGSTKPEIEDMFYFNAMELFGMTDTLCCAIS